MHYIIRARRHHKQASEWHQQILFRAIRRQTHRVHHSSRVNLFYATQCHRRVVAILQRVYKCFRQVMNHDIAIVRARHHQRAFERDTIDTFDVNAIHHILAREHRIFAFDTRCAHPMLDGFIQLRRQSSLRVFLPYLNRARRMSTHNPFIIVAPLNRIDSAMSIRIVASIVVVAVAVLLLRLQQQLLLIRAPNLEQQRIVVILIIVAIRVLTRQIHHSSHNQLSHIRTNRDTCTIRRNGDTQHILVVFEKRPQFVAFVDFLRVHMHTAQTARMIEIFRLRCTSIVATTIIVTSTAIFFFPFLIEFLQDHHRRLHTHKHVLIVARKTQTMRQWLKW
mmetsp:Transcript_49023/g.81449  ORF Transcript_49023/g.81449 Transcript_49023/m.81449 type:complete len:335 (+) Transcript_49023:216-1220(+)